MAESEQEKPQEPKPEEKGISPIRTYQSDVQEILQSGQGSLAKIAIAENDRRTKEQFLPENPQKNLGTKIIYGLSVLLILLGAGTLTFLYFLKNNQTENIVSSQTERPPIIAIDSEKILNVKGFSKSALISALLKEKKDEKVKLASLLNIKMIEETGSSTVPITAESFLSKMQTRAPNELVRSLGDNFMFGLHSLNDNKPFLILKTNYYQNAFAGMIAWEKNMVGDIGQLFIEPEPAVIASTSEQILNKNPIFEDIVVKNRDTRALKDSDGKIIFLYSFPDKNTIVITTNADTLDKIAAKLIASKLVQ